MYRFGKNTNDNLNTHDFEYWYNNCLHFMDGFPPTWLNSNMTLFNNYLGQLTIKKYHIFIFLIFIFLSKIRKQFNIYRGRLSMEFIIFLDLKIYTKQKNPAYGRYWISWHFWGCLLPNRLHKVGQPSALVHSWLAHAQYCSGSLSLLRGGSSHSRVFYRPSQGSELVIFAMRSYQHCTGRDLWSDPVCVESIIRYVRG